MRVLVISRSPWENNNSTGNTLSDIFCELKDIDCFSLCMREAPYLNNTITKENFYISETQILSNILKGKSIGKTSEMGGERKPDETVEEKIYKNAKKHPSIILLFFRELIWHIGRWKNKELDDYLHRINPDIIFTCVFPCWYSQNLIDYCVLRTNAKLVLFHMDDCYSLRQFSISPLYWLYRIKQRKLIRNLVYKASLNYSISTLQREEYGKLFNVDFKLLTKSGIFSDAPKDYQPRNPIKIIYTGNLYYNRWKTLLYIAREIKEINKNECKMIMEIYSGSNTSKRIIKRISITGASRYIGSKPSNEMEAIQNDADILLHVEGFDLKSRLTVRHSFSTKIVDYLKRAKPILAVGPLDVASIKYLNDRDAAIVCNSVYDIKTTLLKIVTQNNLLSEYSRKAYECGRTYHNASDSSSSLRRDFNAILLGEKKEAMKHPTMK